MALILFVIMGLVSLRIVILLTQGIVSQSGPGDRSLLSPVISTASPITESQRNTEKVPMTTWAQSDIFAYAKKNP
jgi:hypothetical protein